MNQSALTIASSVKMQMQGLLLASIEASVHPPMPDTACHNYMILTFSKCCSSHLRPGALTCITLNPNPIIVYYFHSLTATVSLCYSPSLHAPSHEDLWMQAHYLLQYRPVHTLPCPMQHFTINFLGFVPEYSWWQPRALICIEFHDSVSFSQLDCNSATGLTAVSARNIWCGFVEVRLITRCNTDL